MVVQTVKNLDNLSGLEFKDIFTIYKEYKTNRLRIIDENIKAVEAYQEALNGLDTAIAKPADYQRIFNETMKDASVEAKKVAIQIKNGETTAEAYAMAQRSAAASLKELNIASRLAAVGMNALKIAMNVAIITAISFAIEKLIQYLSSYTNAIDTVQKHLEEASQNVEDVNNKISEINSQLDKTNEQIQELQDKGTLTFVEKEQLNNLKQVSKELLLQLETEKALREQAIEEQTQAAIEKFNLLNQMPINPSTGGQGSYTSAVDTNGNYIETYDLSGIEGINKALETYNSLVKSGKQEDKERANEIKNNLLDLANQYSEVISKLDESQSEEAQKIKQNALEQQEAILKVVDAANYLSTQFNYVWEDSTFEDITKELSDLASQGKLTAEVFNQSRYKDIKEAFLDVGLSIRDVVEQINALSQSEKDNVSTLNSQTTALDELTSEFLTINSKISDLQSIQEEYNETGYVSASMLEKLTANNNELMQYVDIVNGKLVVHTEQLNKDVEGLKEQMKATATATLVSRIYGIMQDDLSGKFTNTASAGNVAKTTIDQITESMGNAIAKAATLSEAYQLMLKSFEGIPSSKTTGLSPEAVQAMKNVLEDYRKEIKLIELSASAVKTNVKPKKSRASSSSYTNEALENAKAELEYRKQMGEFTSDNLEQQQYLNEAYLQAVKNLMKYAKTQKEIREINVKIKEAQDQLTESRKAYQEDILEKSYEELETRKDLGLIEEGSLQELQNLLEIQKNLNSANMKLANTKENQLELAKKIYDVEKSILEKQDEQLTNYQSAVEAIIDKQISKIEEREEVLEEAYEKRKERAEKHIEELKKEEEEIEEYYNTQIDAIQEKIDALEDENEKTSKQMALQKAQAALEKALNQKTISIYREGQGFVYEADQSAITEAKEDVASAKYDLKIQQLTEQKEALQDSLDEEKEILEKKIQKWEDYEEKLEKQLDKEKDALENQINAWEDYKQKFEDVTESYELTQQELLIAEVGGANAEAEILAQRLEVVNEFKDKYVALQKQMAQYAEYMVNAAEKAAKAKQKIEELKAEGYSGYASGSSYIPYTQIANVDEQGEELIIRKPQSGRLTMLEKGDAVLNANLTKNIMDLANNAQTILANTLQPKLNVILPSNTKQNYTNVANHFDKLVLPNVTDVNSFISELNHLSLDAKQFIMKN